MDRTSIRAWRRIQKKRVWDNRLRLIFRAFLPTYVKDESIGAYREAQSWQELRKAKGCQVYRTCCHPCSCPMCSGKKYNRLDFKRDTLRILQEKQYDV